MSETYYLIHDLILGKRNDDGDWLYRDGVWVQDSKMIINNHLIGFDASEPEDSPYRIGSTSVMDDIREITRDAADTIMWSR